MTEHSVLRQLSMQSASDSIWRKSLFNIALVSRNAKPVMKSGLSNGWAKWLICWCTQNCLLTCLESMEKTEIATFENSIFAKNDSFFRGRTGSPLDIYWVGRTKLCSVGSMFIEQLHQRGILWGGVSTEYTQHMQWLNKHLILVASVLDKRVEKSSAFFWTECFPWNINVEI